MITRWYPIFSPYRHLAGSSWVTVVTAPVAYVPLSRRVYHSRVTVVTLTLTLTLTLVLVACSSIAYSSITQLITAISCCTICTISYRLKVGRSVSDVIVTCPHVSAVRC